MPNKLKKLLLLQDSLHNSLHDLKTKKKYSQPKIQHYNFNLDYIWYVYYTFRNPITGYMERMPNITCSKTLTKSERLEYLKIIKTNLLDMLKNGFNPFDMDNSMEEVVTMSIEEAFEFALNLKKQTQSGNTHTNYKARIKKFELWLKKRGFEKRFITSINKKVITTYLNEILEKTSARNRDNTRLDLSSLFQAMEDNDIIPNNLVKSINVVGSVPVKNKPFSSQQEIEIYKYIDDNKLKVLSLFIKFVSYTFLRPVEVSRLKIEDINIIDKTIRIKAKTGFQIAIIPDILLNIIPDLSKYPEDSFLIGRTDFGQYWKSTDTNRRNHLSKIFLEVKKILKLSDEYGIYSFRHTFAIKLYNEFIKVMNQDQAESQLMSITRHKTKEALRKYLREINAYRPEDYSKYLE
jgi:integrase